MPDSYLVYKTKNRETGTTIQLYDTTHKDNEFDTSVRWATVCSEHNVVDYYEKQSDAYKAMTSPSSWCSDCADLKAQGIKFGQGAPEEPKAAEPASEPVEEEESEEEEEEVSIDPKN